MHPPPTIREELDRKTLEELERLVYGYENDLIPGIEARASLQTLWQLVAGLVPRETMDLIAQVRFPDKSTT